MKLYENISPMLLEEVDEPFDSDEYFFEVKLDGARTIAHIGRRGVRLQNKRFVDITATYPELSGIGERVDGECILDGELIVVDEDGLPRFSRLQKRAHLKDDRKIRALSRTLPAKFVAFDILYRDGKDLTALPFCERRKLLLEVVSPDAYIEVSQGIRTHGKRLFALIRQNNMEGIVAKRIDSGYFVGKRTRVWQKIKNWRDEDFVIIGFTIQENKPKDLLLAQYLDDRLILRSRIYFSFNHFDVETVLSFATSHFSREPMYDHALISPPDNAIWIEPTLVCTVEYMLLTEHLGMRQPIYKGLRRDKPATSCILPEAFRSIIPTTR